MYQTVVGDDVRHREDPGVARLGEHVRTGAGQRPTRPDELVVHPVHPLGDGADAGEVEPRRRGARQHPGLRARGDQRAYRVRVDPYVRVEVEPREGTRLRVAQPHRVGLPRYRGLDDPYALDRPGRVGGAVATGVGHHDHVELAGRGTGEQPAQVAGEDGFLVVRRYDDAQGRLVHAAKDRT
jgi:hypothetical protein